MADIRKYFAKKYKASDEQINSILDQIGQVETNNRNIPQDNDGPAMGIYQFETEKGSGEFQTALNRIKRVYRNNKNLGEIPQWILDASTPNSEKYDNPLLLEPEQQDSLFLANLAEKGVRGKGSSYGDELIMEALESGNARNLWVHAHWAGPEKDVEKKLAQFDRNVKINPISISQAAVEESIINEDNRGKIEGAG